MPGGNPRLINNSLLQVNLLFIILSYYRFGTIVRMMPTLEKPSLLDTPLKRWFPLNLETLLVVLLLAVAIVSRFYDLGARTMSHDEINHVMPSFSLYSGNGYKYDPMSHGPLQFHMIALSYALFGDNDFTTRIPAAVLSIAAILVALFAFRRYLGRTGALGCGGIDHHFSSDALLCTLCPQRILYRPVGHSDHLCHPALP